MPTHIGPGGNIDSYGSKWLLLGAFAVAIGGFYGVLTGVNRYLYWFYHPANVTGENAPAMYHPGQDILRGIKLIFVWMLVVLAAWFVAAMPDNPKLALGSLIVFAMILVPLISLTALAIIFFVARMRAESKRTKFT